jgi:hypothetical protein
MTTRLFKNVSAKFIELDADGSGQLEGDELLVMAAWLFRLSSNTLPIEPAHSDVIETRDHILATFNKGPDGTLSMSELAVIYDEILVSLLSTLL